MERKQRERSKNDSRRSGLNIDPAKNPKPANPLVVTSPAFVETLIDSQFIDIGGASSQR
jgi:hypothetical protein